MYISIKTISFQGIYNSIISKVIIRLDILAESEPLIVDLYLLISPRVMVISMNIYLTSDAFDVKS